MTDRAAVVEPTADCSLLVDVGSAWTKATLVTRLGRSWRIAAHVAQPSAWGREELLDAIVARLRDGVDPRFASNLEQLVRTAPRIVCRTPYRAGRLALCAVSHDISGAAARHAAEAAGWVVAEEVSADDGRSLLDRLAALQRSDPDAWLLVGGFDDASAPQILDLASIVAAARRAEEQPGPVMWAGSALMADRVEAILGAEMTRLPNPRSAERAGDAEPLRRHLEDLLQQLVEPGGVRQLAPIAFRRGVAELARSRGIRVGAVEIGAQYATWVRAEADGTATGRVFAAGGTGGAPLTATGVPARVARHLAVALDELAVADALQNQRARPAAMPQTEDELSVAHGAARYRLEQITTDGAVAAGLDLLVGAGRVLAGAPSPAMAAMLLVDGLRPVGVTQLAVDAAGILAPIGSLDDLELGEGLAAIASDALVPLGTAVVTRGGRPGASAMHVRVQRAGWGEERFDVRAGQVMVQPLPRGAQADLEIELTGGAALGAPRRVGQIRAEVSGGSVGLILDARDAPLLLPRRSDDRRAVLAGWRDAFLEAVPVGRAP